MYDTHDKDIESLYETNKWGYKYLRFDRKPPEKLVQAYVEEYAINTNCHSSCVSCQIHQINKYKNELELRNDKLIRETGTGLKKWFPIECNYIKKGISGDFKEQLQSLVAKGIPEKRAKRILFASVDPMNWIELMFGFDDESQNNPDMMKHWYLRWYQKHLLKCTAKRRVLRQGRRTGKSAGTVLFLLDKIFNYKVFKGINVTTGEEIYSGPKIAIVTPFQSQVSNIFAEFENFLNTNSDLVERVVQRGSKLYKQTPPLEMEFKNGAIITGFVTGANNKEDGSGGGPIRGANADIIYVDEMDMVPDHIFKNVIQPILYTKPYTMMVGSSTPIGKKGTFYKWCLETPEYKEIYIPSTALPHWPMIEEEALSESTEESFRAEYMAEFITDSYGVFKSEYIHAARSNYSYDMTHDPLFWAENYNENFNEFVICIGIDWNKTIGTEFSVVGWSPRTGHFWVLENTVMPPSKYSGEAYKEETKRLNFKWNPKYIYCDEGHGHFLIENLQVEATYIASKPDKSLYDLSVAELGQKLRTVNFSSNLKLFNPGTGLYFEKYAKSFLVENAVQIFERTKICFAEDDKILVKQLGNYIQVKKQENGKIVYGMENETIGDHRLDALMLALGGLVKEESIFSSSFVGGSGTYYRQLEHEENGDFTSALQHATQLTHLIKNQRTVMQYQGIVTRRGDGTKGSEEAAWREKQWREGNLASKHQARSEIIDPNKASKGFFSKKGAATFVETDPREDYEEHWKSSPQKIAPHNRRKTTRTTTFGEK